MMRTSRGESTQPTSSAAAVSSVSSAAASGATASLASSATAHDGADGLRRAHASLRTVLDASSELVAVHRDGHIVYVNPALVRTLGVLSGDELVGRPIVSLYEVHDRDVDNCAMVESRVLHPTPSAALETFALRWRVEGGAFRTTDTAVTRIDFDGCAAVAVVARDVTERAEFQDRLVERDRMAAIGTLAAGVAHEINNPLTYMLVNLEHVLRRLRAASASDDPMTELDISAAGGLADLVQALQQAAEGAHRVKQVVRDLLTFSQGSVEHRGGTDVRGIVESATQMAWHEIRHRARLVKSLAEVPRVDADEARLGQVFLNLLINAAQAIPEGQADLHEIRVVTRSDEYGRVIVEISDTGVGIPPENISRVFDPFFTTKGETGTGLGLAVSHGTIRSLGGDITVSSLPGCGTTFEVVLPPSKSWRPTPPSSGTDLRALARRKVLVVDDERLVGHAIARVLSEENDVEVVTEARVALERVKKGIDYDVVLCDLMMPIMTGMDLYAEIVRVAPKLAGRLVFMTGGAFTPRARAFLESVGNPCLEKPLDTSKLRSIVARAAKD